MPLLDVSDILDDPDFADTSLVCQRNAQSIGENGLASLTSVSIPFTGVVTQVSGKDLDRGPSGEVITGSILICTRFRLLDGKSGYTADIVTWNGNTYTCKNVLPYSRYGSGFVEATCTLKELSG